MKNKRVEGNYGKGEREGDQVVKREERREELQCCVNGNGSKEGERGEGSGKEYVAESYGWSGKVTGCGRHACESTVAQDEVQEHLL